MAECFLDKESYKYILCIGGGNESIIGIKECIKLGYKIILADKSKKSPALKFCKIFINSLIRQLKDDIAPEAPADTNEEENNDEQPVDDEPPVTATEGDDEAVTAVAGADEPRGQPPPELSKSQKKKLRTKKAAAAAAAAK